MITRFIKYSVISVFLVILAQLFLPTSVFAADPQFMVSWNASSFAPQWYQGKILPSKGSRVNISFELIGQDKTNLGKVLDLSNRLVKWYVNNQYYDQGQGLKSISFPINKWIASDNLSVRISSEVENPSDGSVSFVDNYITIPIVNPEVVIFNKNFSNIINANSMISLSSAPFFFNANLLYDIVPTWTVENKKFGGIANDPFSLSVNFGKNINSGIVDIGLTAQNANNPIESAQSSISFTIQ